MTYRKPLRLLAALTVTAAVAACSSSPDPTYYTLTSVNGTTQPTRLKTVVLRGISLARYLERPPIVLSSASYKLTIAPNDWWGEPLGPMLSRVLTQELAQRLPGSVVLSDTGAINARPDATVEINVQRLDADPDGTVILRAQFGVSRPGAREDEPTTRALELRAAPPSHDMSGTVAAMSNVVGQLADAIAASLATH